jgi:FtsZ-binding cell division protein ZapB
MDSTIKEIETIKEEVRQLTETIQKLADTVQILSIQVERQKQEWDDFQKRLRSLSR